MLRVLAIAVAMIFSTSAMPQGNVLCIGNFPCKYVDFNKFDIRALAIGWFGGYLTGINVLLQREKNQFIDVKDFNNPDLIAGTLIGKCLKNPDLSIQDAATQIIFERPRLPWPPR